LAAIDQQRQLYAAAQAALIDPTYGGRVMPQLVEWHDAFVRNFVVDGANPKVRASIVFDLNGVTHRNPPDPKANLRFTYALQGSATLARALRAAAKRSADAAKSSHYSTKADEIAKLSFDIGEQFYRDYADPQQPGRYFLYASGQPPAGQPAALSQLSHNNSQNYLIEGMAALAELDRNLWQPRLEELLSFIRTQRDPDTGLLHEFHFVSPQSANFPSNAVQNSQFGWQARNGHETVIVGHTLAGLYAGPARLLANSSKPDKQQQMTALVEDFVERMNHIGGIHQNGLLANAFELVPSGQPSFIEVVDWPEGAWQVELLWQFLLHADRAGVDLSKFEVKAGQDSLPLDRLLARGLTFHDEKLFNGTSYVLENGQPLSGREEAAPINHAADTLRDLCHNLTAPFWHSCVDNEIKAFVYTILGLYDKHIPVNELTSRLVNKDLEMSFPDAEVRSHQDFEKWYQAVQESVRWNSHRIEQLDIRVVDHRRYQVDMVLLWIGAYKENQSGQPFAYRVHQNWILLESDNPPRLRIRRYIITQFDQLPTPPLIP
jgi:hypothetical protein